jgi:hypothetical protein
MTRFGRAAMASVVGVAALSVSSRAATPDPFTLVFIPDPQNYTKTQTNTDKYYKPQTQWIVNNTAALNIKFTMALGDMQQDGNPYHYDVNNIYQPDLSKPVSGGPDNDIEFQRSSSAIKILDDARIPYSVVPGNHDYIDWNTKDEPIYYLKYFGPQRYDGSDPTFGPRKPSYGGAMGTSSSNPTGKWAGLNTWHMFDAGGYKFLNLALQYQPDTNDLRWAQGIINAHPGIPTVVTTHAYIDNNSINRQNIFDDLVNLNPQIILTVNGHIIGGNNVITSTNVAGLKVHQMVVDYQGDDIPGEFVGGGFLRYITFDQSANQMQVKSYSPKMKQYMTDAKNQFNLAMNLKSRFGLADGGGIKKSATFRDGVSGYSGTRDTYLREDDAGTNFGTGKFAWVDGNTSNNQDAQAMVRFDFTIADAIPDGAMIDKATLTLHTSTDGASESPDTMRAYRILDGWTEGGATWTSKGSGLTNDGNDLLLAADDSAVPSVAGGYVTFDVTEAMSAFAAGAPNNGWAILPGGNNGWKFDTREADNVAFRPQLSVEYRIVPEPAVGFAIIGLLVSMSLSRPMCKREARAAAH